MSTDLKSPEIKNADLSNIRIVLVNPSHAGNIGAVARAMKNMGLSDLYLVNPKNFPDDHANARSAGADDLLEKAVVTEKLDEAIADSILVIGTSTRSRRLSWPTLNPEECASKILRKSCDGIIAIVFGNERTGLSNEELDKCQFFVTIPTDPNFSSLNLAAAVQIITYELRKKCISMQQAVDDEIHDDSLASQSEVQGFFKHLEKVLIAINFLDPAHPKKLMRRLYRLFHRAQLVENEVNILRGILTSVEKAAGLNPQGAREKKSKQK